MEKIYNKIKEQCYYGDELWSIAHGKVKFISAENGIIECEIDNSFVCHFNSFGQICWKNSANDVWRYDDESQQLLYITKPESPTVKGYQNRDREFIQNPNPQKVIYDMGKYVDEIIVNKSLIKFDKEKDFTVSSMIEALSKYDKDLPVCIAMDAPAIGYYDLHIHKVDKYELYGFDKDECVALFADPEIDD